jgi:signal transduction histidine kinase
VRGTGLALAGVNGPTGRDSGLASGRDPAAENMKASRLYPLVFDAVRDPLLMVDRNGVVMLANAAALSFFTFGESHSLGSMVCTEPDCVFDSREVTDLMRQYDSVRDYTLKNRNGRDSGITVDIDSVYVKDGDPSFKLLHFRNRSAGRQRELWRDELISLVSHEIKNPLSAMKNSVEILLSQMPGELTEGQKRFLNTSERSIDRLTHLLDGFLDVSRISAGAFQLNRSDVDVRQFVKDVIESFTTLFNVKRVNLDWTVEGAVTKGYLDQGKLEQVVINLLSNALKFTPEHGDIAVSAGTAGVEKVSDDLRLLPWNALGEPRLLEIVVEDTGLGMSAETLDHLFNRYHRTGDAGHGRGAHLGLSISKALVEAQDGWLDIVSELGIGTRVSVFVPQDRHTACVLSRTRRACDLVTSWLGARRTLTLFTLGKLDGEDWDDICRSWSHAPVVNPGKDIAAGSTFHMWTINKELAIAVLLGHGEDEMPDLAGLFGPQFVQCEESSFMFSGYAVGACRAPSETGKAGGSGTFAQLCNIAMTRMDIARNAMARSMAEKMASEIESMMVDLGR